MLEEEEFRDRYGEAGLKKIAWPPLFKDQRDFLEQSPAQSKPDQTPDIDERTSYCSNSPVNSLSSRFPTNNPLIAAPLSPLPATDKRKVLEQLSFSQTGERKVWAPVTLVTSPSSPLVTFVKDHSQELHNPSFRRLDCHQETKEVYRSPSPVFEPPPSLIRLRDEPPLSQLPPIIYQAQPAANLAAVSGNMRGDMKWPPESVKLQADAESSAKLELARGPAYRPRRVAKDYSKFFAKHALTNNYPGYRAPPGTQYFNPACQERFEASIK